MKASFFKRVGAYFIDIFLVALVTGFISGFLPNSEKIVELSGKHSELMNEYIDNLTNENLEETKKIFEEVESAKYDLEKVSIYSSLTGIIIYGLYFIVFQSYNNGQTVGKKLLGIEIVDKNGDTASMKKLLIRSVLVYSILFDLISVICLMTMSKALYLDISVKIVYIHWFIFVCCGLMLLFGRRALHDIAAGTEVIVCGSYDVGEDKVSNWKNTSEKAKRVYEYQKRHTSGRVKGKI